MVCLVTVEKGCFLSLNKHVYIYIYIYIYIDMYITSHHCSYTHTKVMYWYHYAVFSIVTSTSSNLQRKVPLKETRPLKSANTFTLKNSTLEREKKKPTPGLFSVFSLYSFLSFFCAVFHTLYQKIRLLVFCFVFVCFWLICFVSLPNTPLYAYMLFVLFLFPISTYTSTTLYVFWN